MCRVVAADERTQRYERVVVMALYGLSLTFQRLPDQFIADRREEWEEFVSEKRLWKLTRHDNPYVTDILYTCTMSCIHTYCIHVQCCVYVHMYVCMYMYMYLDLNSAS